MTAMTLPAKPWTNGMLTADQRYQYDSTVGAEGAWRASPIPVGGLPAGSIIQWSSNTIPANWLLCDGSAVSRTVYPSLFAAIGTQYGVGDGSTTFNLPDLRGRVAVGKNGGSFGTLGATGGAETHTHTEGTLAANIEPFTAAGYPYIDWKSKSVVGNYVEDVRVNIQASGSNTTTGRSEGNGNGVAVSGTTASASSMPPYLVTNYIIKATIGVTAGDSQLATRVGVLEQNPVITGNLTVMGNSFVAGRQSATLQPSFLAISNAFLQAQQNIVCEDVRHNVGGHYNSSNGRFTAPIAGTYTFSFHTLLYDLGYATSVWFYKNGTQTAFAGVYGQHSGTYSGQGGTVSMYLNANDYVNPFMVYNGTKLHGGYTTFSGHLVA